MKRDSLFLLVAAAVILVMAPASLSAQTGTLGTNFSLSNWNSSGTWTSSFDATSIDGGFSPSGTGGLGVGFYTSTASTGDAILEKHFARASGDTNAYNVTLNEVGEGWNSLTEAHYIDYSLNGGATWTRFGPTVMSSNSAEGAVTGIVTVTGSDSSLWVRYGVVDDHDGTYPSNGPGSYIISVGASFAVNTTAFLGTNFSVTSWPASWANNFDLTSIDGAFSVAAAPGPYPCLSVGFYGLSATGVPTGNPNAPSNGDALLEKHFDRAPGDTSAYGVMLLETGAGWNRMDETDYISYSIDQGTTWTQLSTVEQTNYYNVHKGTTVGYVGLNPSVQSLWVRYAVQDIGDWTASLSGEGSQIWTVSAQFSATPGTMGTSFEYGSPTAPAWASNWQSSFDYTSIDGAWNLADSWLGIGFNGQPISNTSLLTGDAILDKYFVRAAGDTHTYDVVVNQDAKGWLKLAGGPSGAQVHYIDSSGGGNWTQLDQVTEGSYSIQSLNGAVTIGPSVAMLAIRNGVVDDGDWSVGMTGGGSAIYDVSDTFKTVELAQLNYTFNDTYATDESELYESNGDAFGHWISGAPDLFSNGAFNYVTYCFARQSGDPTLLTANISATVVNLTGQPLNLYYSFDDATWTLLQSDSVGTWTPATLTGTVNMGSNARLYVRIGGQTQNNYLGNAWYAAVESVTVAFPPPPPLTMGALRSSTDGAQVSLNGAVVTFVDTNNTKFVIESTNRSGAIVVNLANHGFVVGDMVNVIGTIQTESFGLRYIQASSASLVSSGNIIKPLAMETKSVGGGPFNYNSAVPHSGIIGWDGGADGGTGFNNMSMLVKIWGKIAQLSTPSDTEFTIQGTDGRIFNCLVETGGVGLATEGYFYGTVVGVIDVNDLDTTTGLPYPLIILRNITDFNDID